MKLLAAIAVFILSTALVAADAVPASPPETGMRPQQNLEFKSVKAQAEVPAAAPGAGSQTEPATATPPEGVTMDRFTVGETETSKRLAASIAHEEAAARTAMLMDKLGIGLHVVPVCKCGLFAGTIFYIPFTAGISISW